MLEAEMYPPPSKKKKKHPMLMSAAPGFRNVALVRDRAFAEETELK